MSDLQQQHQCNTEQVLFGAVQHNLSDILPSASEVGHLWTSYLAECMSVCFLKYYVAKSKDPDIHAVLQRALDVSSQRINTMEDIFNSIHHPIPEAYGENDVDVNAKQLFSESFTLQYTRLMHKFILINYSKSLSTSSRSDVRRYFSECLNTSQEVHQKATEVLLAKGLLEKCPSIMIPDRVDFVHNTDYLGSILGLGNQRPLNAIEISHIVTLMETKQLLKTLNLGYAQVVKSEKVKRFISQAKQTADKQLKKLSSYLEDEDLPQPILTANLVTDSTESPHSDKLIMCHVTVVIATIIAEYGLSLSNNARKDLAATFANLVMEVLSLAKDGAELMIESGWLEKVPQTANRKELIN
ncbi:DUF3231 family protein [Desulfosporosinus fructosivorans]|uniref:DUF3231 family protein n=1 Tax=Desulfosporosinus fructosivorans TaxID=2018669 RepID=A0A4Z0RBC3_9FIRM|nr:DUF3231 family protein [Desulfosporosinus fructosivorans]TGE39754.1 DUF3231 family protein [Desulfosporosinus fructosivorans]